jgi:cadmium resistance protein CadD (predicted permease)
MMQEKVEKVPTKGEILRYYNKIIIRFVYILIQ